MLKYLQSFSVKTTIGFLIVLVGIVFVTYGLKQETTRLYSFESEPVDVSGFSESQEVSKELPKQITIAELLIDLPVIKAEIVEGYWEVFEDSAGWGSGSGYPGENGNQVIFAHARDGLFLPLLYSKIGQEILITTESNNFTYIIEEIKEVYPDQLEVIKPTEEEILTLYTCSGFQDKKRLIVTAKRI